jgi:uncharacterized protein with NRDE domain
MCIALLTTAHPSYALIILDNRDEFLLRPTSRPHWWTAQSVPTANGTTNGDAKPKVQEILSSRDLQRPERGTWLGVTKAGNFAVLTNYRETDAHDATHPVSGRRSRGGMVTAWLAADPSEPTTRFVHRMLDGGVKGVGGFSLICGKLRRAQGGDGARRLEPMAIISNRNESIDEVPWICGEEGRFYGLSNTSYSEQPTWPKVKDGIKLAKEAIKAAVAEEMDEDCLMETLFAILDRDTLPVEPEMGFEDYIPVLKESIFVPAIGDDEQRSAMEQSVENGRHPASPEVTEELASMEEPDEACQGFETGMYGTQRQTVLLVDWDGNVTYRERSLWDASGNPIPRGTDDSTFKFKVDGWE